MKRIVGLSIVAMLIIFAGCNAQTPDKRKENKNIKAEAQKVNVIHLTNETFKQKVFNYSANKDWKYVGNKPAIIDFYADWCGPCRMVSPLVEELAKEYSEKIVVYKVNTDVERELSQNLGIQSLPTLLFIPMKGKPQAAMGALPKDALKKAIEDVLLK